MTIISAESEFKNCNVFLGDLSNKFGNENVAYLLVFVAVENNDM